MIAVAEVAVGGLIGAPTRYIADQIVNARAGGEFPWGTFVVNTVGAFVLGLVSGLATYHRIGNLPATVVGTGFCGALTTFSTFSYETVRLLEEGTPRGAAWNVIGSLVLGLGAAGAGLALAAVV